MTCESCSTNIDILGADPLRVQWKVIRGDSGSLRVEFLEDDEITFLNISDWSFLASAYYPVSGNQEPLTVSVGSGFVDINITPTQSSAWGNTFSTVVAELGFDLQITKPDNTVWTPVIGTICVLGDITGGSL